jgi:hypothetical protein
MKLLVLAADAQSGVGAGRKGGRVARNGMRVRARPPRRPEIVAYRLRLGRETCMSVQRALAAV